MSRYDDPGTRLENLIYQARSLSRLLMGEGGEAFQRCHITIQDGVHWLLADLLDECNSAFQEMHRPPQGKQGGVV